MTVRLFKGLNKNIVVLSCAIGLAAFAASLVAGLLRTHVGASAPFIYGGAISAISCAACDIHLINLLTRLDASSILHS